MKSKSSTKPEKKANSAPLPPCGVLIESHRHRPDFSTAAHAHRYNSIIYVVSGHGKCVIDENSHSLVPNSVVILPKGRTHQLIDAPKKAMVVFVVYFSAQIARQNADLWTPLLKLNVGLIIPTHQARRMRNTLRRMLHEQDAAPIHYETAIQQYLSSILLELNRTASTTHDFDVSRQSDSSFRVSGVLDYIAENYYEHHSLSEAAKMAHISQRQFSNICRKLKGRSFVQFVNSVRSEKAKEFLQKTDMPVSAVAFEVGFEELSTFYRAFRKHHKSPLTFRK